MKLKERTLQELREIVATDYGVSISDDEAKDLGVSLLRLTRIGCVALARADEKKASIQARGRPLEPKTST